MTAFLALLRRDLVVASRNASLLLVSALTQPILVILVFGNILPRLGLVAADFGTVMVPGLMAIAILMAGVQGVLIPLVQDLSGSREVDERLLAPMSVFGVSAGRIVAGAIHAATAGLVAGPAMILLMHGAGLGDVRPQLGAPPAPRGSLRAPLGRLRPHPGHERPAPLQRPAVRGRARADDALRLRVLPVGAARRRSAPSGTSSCSTPSPS